MPYYDPRKEKDEFDAQHGERVQFGDFFYFEDGASRTIDAIAELRPPPTDEFERLTMILYFHRARLTRAVQAFDKLKEDLSHTDGNGNGLTHLEELQALVSKRRREVEKAKDALDNTATGRARKGAAQFRQEEAARQAAWQGKLREIRI